MNWIKRRMRKLIENKTLWFVMVTTYLLGFVTHGYAFLNQFYSHDSIQAYRDYSNAMWAAKLGRYFYPVMNLIRGYYYPPLLIGFLSLTFVGLGAYLLLHIWEVKNRLWQALIVGILVTCRALTITYTTYMHDVDAYMLGFLSACVSLYLIRKKKPYIYFAPITVWLTCGLYQSYLFVTVSGLMILAILDLLENKETKVVLVEGLKAILTLVCGALLYFIGLPLFRRLYNIEYVVRKNSITQLLQLTPSNVPTLLKGLYQQFFERTFQPHLFHSQFVSILIWTLALVAFIVLIYRFKEVKRKDAILVVLVLLGLLPLGTYGIYLLTSGVVNDLMTYSLCLIYIFFILVISRYGKRPGWLTYFEAFSCVLVVCMLFDAIVYANDSYLKKELENRKTAAVMNRILMRIEENENYVPNETPIVFIGKLYENPYFSKYKDLDYSGAGIRYTSSITYYDTYKRYLNIQMNYGIKILDETTAKEYAVKEEVKQMPCFPDKDSIQYIDDVLVIKISE
ncbi:MAG: glucosyltransferase domain-containing protein [Solobacterium sp.]|nr:glucosyltransferase domain-containing protein [Solobacterium sp.]